MAASWITEKAAEIIFANEGNYGSVNKNDNGAVSVGKVQWHGNRALSLLRTIVAKNLQQAGEILGNALKSEISANQTNWSSRIVSSEEATKLSTLLSTPEGKQAQDALAIQDIGKYIKKGENYGLTDPGALIYFADGVNQYGTNSSLWRNIAKDALKSTGDVDAMYAATTKRTSKYLSRRAKVYEKVKALNLKGEDKVKGVELKSGIAAYSVAAEGALSLLIDGKVSNFKVREFACRDGSDSVLIDEKLVRILQKARDNFGKPIEITSGYRTPAHNQKVGGASSSYHVKGQAADIQMDGVDHKELAKFFEAQGVKGIGFYNYVGGFVHVDTRTRKYLWQQDSKNAKYYQVSTFGAAPAAGFKTGTYILTAAMKVRTGPGSNYPQKPRKSLTADGQKHAFANGVLKKGTAVTVKKVIQSGSDYWALTPSGYVAMQMNGKTYMERKV